MADLARILSEMKRETEDLRRRGRGRVREGRVVEADAATGLYRVDVGREGAPLLTPWIKAETLSSGALKIQAEPTIGQHVKVTSENGELTDGMISSSGFDDADPRPHGANGEMRMTVGALDVAYDGSAATFVAGGVTFKISGSGVTITGGSVTHNGTDIGDTHKHGGVTKGPSSTDVPN